MEMESIACMPRFAFSSDATAAASTVIGSIGVVNQKRYEYDHGHLQSEERTTQGLTTSSLFLLLLLLFSKKEQDTIHLDNNNKATTGCSGCALG